ncbi:MAG: hypothetical protein ACJZ49_06260 [Candidatus Thalassarchaeaceae archaeon]|nr:MAG: hypothetical protein CBC45_005815 [Euryarchaeota archaeon TMED85]
MDETSFLPVYSDLESCPDCGAISRNDTVRCPECGRFNTSIHLREEATVEQARQEASARSVESVDPSFYSLNPDSSIEVESDQLDDEEVSRPWEGGSTDFRFEEE